jgi:hypothetical protein
MTAQLKVTPSGSACLPGLKALTVAVGVTVLAATGAWAAEHQATLQQDPADALADARGS